MKRTIFLNAPAFLLIISCGQSPDETNLQTESTPAPTSLPAMAFSEQIRNNPDAVVLDVRTAEEFSKGHIHDALNIDWQGEEFGRLVGHVDKSLDVYIYCLSGARSAAAAETMRKNGYGNVIELEGGILKWNAEDMPLDKPDHTATGMSREEFDALIDSEKLVLVDFYADWCAPCRKMAPHLKAVAEEMASTLTLVRINVDDHPELCKNLGIDALPVLQIYRHKSPVWEHKSYIDKSGLEAAIHQNRGS